MTNSRILLVVALIATAVVGGASPASAATFTVDSAADGADLDPGNGTCRTLISETEFACTLWAAIEEANQTPERDDITFNIPGDGPHTISVTENEPLPAIEAPVRILGYTEPGASANTIADPTRGTNATLGISLRGPGETGSSIRGLRLQPGAAGSVISGLAVTNFPTGIDVIAPDVQIRGNFIGTDPFGVVGDGNEFGVFLSSNGNTVGGTTAAARNLISANYARGIHLSGNDSLILGNVIGTKKDASTPLGNGSYGVGTAAIAISGDRNVVGDTDVSDGTTGANVIAHSGYIGIIVFQHGHDPARANRISANRIFSNGALGIDLLGSTDFYGVTPNDPNDTDSGPNGFQNFPVLRSASTVGFTTTITGTLRSRPSTEKLKRPYIIQFFRSTTPDDSGYGEGEWFLGETVVQTNRVGAAKISFSPREKIPLGEYVTATATDARTGDTSEFSKSRIVEAQVSGG